MTTDTKFHIPWHKATKPAVGLSIILLLLSVYSFISRGLNWGLDFTGGSLIEVSYNRAVDLGTVREQLEAAGLDGGVVQFFGTAQDLTIRLPQQQGVEGQKVTEQVLAALRSDGSDVTANRAEFVGPSVGAELVEDGALAMLVSFLGILMYVAFRYEWKFAAGAVLALVHDVAITLGVFSWFQIEFDLTVLAAIMTVIGYSLNDTVVVFDRMKENFIQLRNATPWEAASNAINSMLVRTLVMTATVLIVLISLYFYGGTMIHNFSIALLVGVAFGTYSSIYVATALAIGLGVSREDLLPVVVEKEGADLDAMP